MVIHVTIRMAHFIQFYVFCAYRYHVLDVFRFMGILSYKGMRFRVVNTHRLMAK